MTAEFHYRHDGETYFGPIYTPIISIQFKGKTQWHESVMIADTGAYMTLIPIFLTNVTPLK